MNIKRRKVVGHRIQDGEAIIDISFYNENKPIPENYPLKWVGDAYKLRDELNEIIEKLEYKVKRRN